MTIRSAPPVPHSNLSEEALLAALMLDSEAAEFSLIRQTVKPGDFFNEVHRWTYEACIASLKHWQIVTIPTVAYELEQAGLLDNVGTEAELVAICGRWFTAIGAIAHARLIADCARRRILIDRAGRDARAAYRGESSQRGWVTSG